jgi:hypothetical protein
MESGTSPMGKAQHADSARFKMTTLSSTLLLYRSLVRLSIPIVCWSDQAGVKYGKELAHTHFC